VAFDADWAAMNVEQQLKFALEWETNPTAKWNQVKSVSSTLTVLQILYEIACLRSTIEVYQDRLGATFDIGHINTSEPLSAAKLADTDGAVQTDPHHAGGWWGLLTINNSKIEVSGGTFPLRFPPGTASFRTAFDHLTTTARGSSASMLEFTRAERAGGGLRHLALTLKYLVYTNADEMVAVYLRSLRGHGPDETGHEHHLRDMVALARDVDERFARTQVVITLGTILERFPQVFSGTGAVSEWDDRVTEHLGIWLVGMGNHADGLKWLRGELKAAKGKWGDTQRMATRLKGSRDVEKRDSTSVTTRLETMRQEATKLRTELSKAYRQGSSTERTNALQKALSTTRGWRTKFGSSTMSSLTSSQASKTDLKGDASFDILIADGSLDMQEEITVGLEEKLQETLTAETESSGSTTEGTTTTVSETARSHWESLLTMVKAYERQITNEWRRSDSYTRTVDRVRKIADIDQQVIAVADGIDQFMRAQGWD